MKCIYEIQDPGTDSLHRKISKALTNNHVSFITMDDSAQGTNKHLRIGGQNSILMFNRESDDATLPNLSPDGTASSKPLPANTWTCFEYHLSPDGGIETWLDDAAISGLTTASSNPFASQWRASSIKPKITSVNFGWESYGGDTNTIWYDDVVVSSSRIGCGGSAPQPTSTSLPVSTTTRIGGTTLSTTTRRADTTTTRQVQTTTRTPTTTTTTTASSGGAQQSKWGQCGGIGWTGKSHIIRQIVIFQAESNLLSFKAQPRAFQDQHAPRVMTGTLR